MNTIKDFLSYTNLKGARVRYTLLLTFASILYCIVYNVSTIFMYASQVSTYYYIGIYLINILAAFFYMLIISQFLMLKRGDTTKLAWKKYFSPVILVQSIYFVFLAGGGYLSYFFMMNDAYQTLYYIVTVITILAVIFYLPLQIFGMFYIYDGEKNPFTIIGKAFMKIMRHYQSVFYTLLAIFLVMACFTWIMNMVYNYGGDFIPSVAAMDIMMRNNPFLVASELITSVLSNQAIWIPAIISIIYGFIMCALLVYFYMVMVCIHDEDIRV